MTQLTQGIFTLRFLLSVSGPHGMKSQLGLWWYEFKQPTIPKHTAPAYLGPERHVANGNLDNELVVFGLYPPRKILGRKIATVNVWSLFQVHLCSPSVSHFKMYIKKTLKKYENPAFRPPKTLPKPLQNGFAIEVPKNIGIWRILTDN